MARTGNGTSFSLSASSFTASYLSIGGHTESRAALDDTSLSNSTYMSKCPDDLVDIDETEMQFFWDETVGPPPIAGTSSSVQTGTVTYSSSETLSGSGFITRITHPEHVNGSLRQGTFGWQWDGKTGPTYLPTT